MEELRLDDALLPELCWNTHAACLQRLCSSAGYTLDLVDIAGFTGLGFRTVLCREATPPSLYHTWSWGPQFRGWLDALGLDADIAEHRTYMHSYPAWLQRQYEHIAATLDIGFPVLYWDNLGFALILGTDAGGYWVSGLPEPVVNPLWRENRDALGLIQRLQVARAHDGLAPRHVAPESLSPAVDDNALFIYTRGVAHVDQRQAQLEGLYNAWAELSGLVEHRRVLDDYQHAYSPQYGSAALERWREELKAGRCSAFGLLLNINTLAEARRWGAKFLLRAVAAVDEQQRSVLEQAAKLLGHSVDHWRVLQDVFSPPVNEKEQLTRANIETCREELYQILQSETTAAKLLGTVVRELLADDA